MAWITLSVSETMWKELKKLSWINWSEIGRIETQKKVIFEKYLRSKKISNKDLNYVKK